MSIISDAAFQPELNLEKMRIYTSDLVWSFSNIIIAHFTMKPSEVCLSGLKVHPDYNKLTPFFYSNMYFYFERRNFLYVFISVVAQVVNTSYQHRFFPEKRPPPPPFRKYEPGIEFPKRKKLTWAKSSLQKFYLKTTALFLVLYTKFVI